MLNSVSISGVPNLFSLSHCPSFLTILPRYEVIQNMWFDAKWEICSWLWNYYVNWGSVSPKAHRKSRSYSFQFICSFFKRKVEYPLSTLLRQVKEWDKKSKGNFVDLREYQKDINLESCNLRNCIHFTISYLWARNSPIENKM